MKNIIFISLIFISCNVQSQKVNLLDYVYPIESLKEAKVFIYNNVDSTRQKWYVCQQSFINQNDTLFVKYSLEGNIRDSSIFKIKLGKSELVKRFRVKNKKIIIGKIIEYSNNGLETKSIIEMGDFLDKNIYSRTEGNSLFDCILEYEYNGTSIKSIKFKDYTSIWTLHRNYTSIKRNFKLESESIYGIGLGMIYFSTRNNRNNKISSWQLEQIVKLKDFIKK